MPTTTWSGAAHDTSWFDANNWNAGIPLVAGATTFSDGGTWSVNLAALAAATTSFLSVASDHLTFSGGTLALSGDPRARMGSALSIGGAGSITVAAGATITLASPYGELDVGRQNGAVTTPGSLVVRGRVDAATVQVSGGSQVVVVGGTLDGATGAPATGYGYLTIGAALGGVYLPGDGAVLVRGAGSTLAFSSVLVGGGDATAALDVRVGASATIGALRVGGGTGAARVTVIGAGSTLAVATSLIVGDGGTAIPNGAPATLTVIDGGTLDAGASTLDLSAGALFVDASAHLNTAIYDVGGSITALADVGTTIPGTTDLIHAIQLGSHAGTSGDVATFSSDGGSVLRIDGAVLGTRGPIATKPATFAVDHGHVVLANGANQFAVAEIKGGTLEIAATGAAGAGTVTFVATGPATLLIDPGVSFANLVAGFGGHDTIDLAGFNPNRITETFAGGRLTLTGGGHSASLNFAGSYSVSSFVIASDHRGGTAITLAHP